MASHPSTGDIVVVEKLSFCLIAETFFFALYIVLITYLVFRPCVTRKATSLPSFVLIFTLCNFTIYTLYWALDVYILSIRYHSLISPEFKEGNGKSGINHMSLKGAPSTEGIPPESFAIVYVQWVAGLTLIVFGDFVSLWRAWVVFGKPRWLNVLLIGIAAAESVGFLLLFISTATVYFPTSPTFFHAWTKARTPLTFFGYALAGLAQLGSTSLISYKAWDYWREVRGLQHPSMKPRSQASTALAIVIESGIAYVGLLAWYGFIDFFGEKGSTVVSTVRFYSIPLIAMYPTLVVVLVAFRCSVLEPSTPPTFTLGSMRIATSLAHGQGSTSRPHHISRPALALPNQSLNELELGRSTTSANDVSAPEADETRAHDEEMKSSTDRSRVPPIP